MSAIACPTCGAAMRARGRGRQAVYFCPMAAAEDATVAGGHARPWSRAELRAVAAR